MERQNILFLTLYTGHKVESQGGAKKDQFIKCAKDVVFHLKTRGERFQWWHLRLFTNLHIYTNMCLYPS
jgi:hypothetical protein